MASEKLSWFETSKEGLSKIARRKGLAFILLELVQNAWDTNATHVRVTLEPIKGVPRAKLRVSDDDPNGFRDLSHGYTLFAESEKKGNASLRGRFNLGEKLVLSICESARLSTTTGTVIFEGDSRRLTRERTSIGSVFEAEIRMTLDEMQEVLDASNRLLPPIPTFINGERLPTRDEIHSFAGTLPTEVADNEGYLKRTTRRTVIKLYTPHEGVSYIYELGIPVVETDFPWSIDVGQKIPLNVDRDNVTPAYRKALGVLVLNEMHGRLKDGQASSPIVQEALTSPDVSTEAIDAVLTQQYGKNRVVYDPSDKEANHRAAANNFAVIHGGAFSREAWTRIKAAGVIKPAGQIFPTPKPYDPEGKPAQTIPEPEWTEGMRAVADFCQSMAQQLMGVEIQIVMEKERSQRYLANYGSRRLTFNVPRLRPKLVRPPTQLRRHRRPHDSRVWARIHSEPSRCGLSRCAHSVGRAPRALGNDPARSLPDRGGLVPGLFHVLPDVLHEVRLSHAFDLQELAKDVRAIVFGEPAERRV